MSHWTKVKLKITSEDVLVKALKRMGCENVQTGEHPINQYGVSDTANVWIDNAVGFKKEKDGSYSMIGDFYHSKTTMRKYYGKNNEFEEDLNAAYGIEDAITKIDSLGLGFSLTGNAECEEDEEGIIRLEFTTYNDIA